MDGIIFINYEGDLMDEDTCKYFVSYDDNNDLYNYSITINLGKDESFKDLISNYDEVNEQIESMHFLFENDDVLKTHTSGEERKFYKDNLENGKKLLESAKYVELSMPIDKAILFLKNNLDLINRKVIINVDNNLDIIIAKKLASSVNISNLSFRISGNNKIINFKEYVNTIYAIDKIVKKIRMLELSPFEQILYVYNILKDRIYCEAEDQDYSNSRDLSKALLGKNIVCVGFTVIFNTILNQLGIDAKTSILDSFDDKNGHERSEIHVVDSKYKVDGVYYFDATWDSKEKDDDMTYLYSYIFFAKTKSEMDIYDKKKKIYDIHFPKYSDSLVMDFYDEFKQNGLKNVSKMTIKSIEHMYHLIKGKILFPGIIKMGGVDAKRFFNIENYIDELLEINDLFNKPLYADVLLKVLYNVRKKECFYGEKDRMYTEDELFKIYLMSKWNFDNPVLRLLSDLTGRKHSLIKEEVHEFVKFIKNSSFELEEEKGIRK